MPTALITGATAGIGLAFVHALAEEGYDLVAVARDEDRLAKLAAGSPDVAVTPLPADLTTVKGRAAVADRLRTGVDLLVNNAGASLNAAFDRSAWADERRLLHLHVETVLQLCHAAVPAMLVAGHGDIINVSSVAGFFPTAGGPTYAAQKAFVTALSQGLAAQYADRGVCVMALCPGFTHTEFHERAGLPTESIPARLWLDADRVVADGLKDLRRGRPVSVPGLAYKGLVATGRYVPPPLLRAISGVARRRRGRP
jgi:short-subunit dehydrogenase